MFRMPRSVSATRQVRWLRELYIKLDGKIVAGLVDEAPTLTDVMLRPREVAFLLMFRADQKTADGRTAGSVIADEHASRQHETLVAELKIEKAPAGSMDGQARHRRDERSRGGGQAAAEKQIGAVRFSISGSICEGKWKLPGGLVGRLGDKVKEFIRMNTGDASGDPLREEDGTLRAATRCHPRLDAGRGRGPDG